MVRAVDSHNAVTKVLGEDLGLVVVGCDLVVVGCDWCWVGRGAWVWWVCGGLGEELDLGLGVVGCCDWVSGGLLRLGIVIGSAVEEEIWVLVAEVYGVDC
uniref:Uncharacterized protein n=1 Tax=Fagus sylvatica TaxID=28930 RepID=A0A2N9GZ94_FAGSY